MIRILYGTFFLHILFSLIAQQQRYSDKEVIPLVIINPQPAGDLLMMLTISYFASHISDKEGTTNSKHPSLHTVKQARTAGNQGTILCICF